MLKTVFSDCKNSSYVKTFRLSLPWEITLINIKSIPQTSRIFIKFRFWYHMSRLNQCSGQAIYYISLFSKIRWGLTYLPTQKSDVIYECSLTLIGMSYESKKNAPLAPPRGIFYKAQWAWQALELTRFMSIFASKSFGNFW